MHIRIVIRRYTYGDDKAGTYSINVMDLLTTGDSPSAFFTLK